ncbi:MAG: DUF1127 domain-containing protein [Pseudomonadota bacterium]
MTDATITPSHSEKRLFTRFAAWLHLLARARETERGLQEIAQLDDHLLDDIGLTRADVDQSLDITTRLNADKLRQSTRIWL